MFAYYFPPTGGIGVMRALKFAKYLPEYGYDVTVCTRGFADYYYVHDKSLLEEIEHIHVIRIQDMPKHWKNLNPNEQQEIFDLYTGIIRSNQWAHEYIEMVKDTQVKLIPEEAIIWVNECIKTIEKHIKIADYDIIYTTSAPYSAHFIGYYLRKQNDIKWVMDYRDPWTKNSEYCKMFCRNKRTIQLEESLEDALLSKCDAVETVSEFYGTKDISIITNGYDEEDYDNLESIDNKEFTLCYNGRIYPKDETAFITILEIINDIINEGSIKKEKIQVIINDPNDYPFYRQNDKHGIVKNNGILPHKRSIELANSSYILILFGAWNKEGAQFWRTGKSYGYFRIMKPILNIGVRIGELYEEIKELNQGITVLTNEKSKIKDFVLKIYNEKKEGTNKHWGDMQKVKKYDRRNLTGELARVFDGVLSEGKQ